MPDGLAFTLYAPLAAMGDLAVGESRGGFDRPGRSAVLGLVAAALGLDRTDEAGHAALDRGYRLAQRVRRPGDLVSDYHTVQAPPASRRARPANRREALGRPSHELATLLSSREYRADVWVDVALVRVEAVGPPPEAIAEALRRPAYTLFFGRKSCPLGRPVHPHLARDVATLGVLLEPLDRHRSLPADAEDDVFAVLRLDRVRDAPLYADLDLRPLLAPDFEPRRVERRRDRVASRARRQFELRDELVAWPIRPAAWEAAP